MKRFWVFFLLDGDVWARFVREGEFSTSLLVSETFRDGKAKENKESHRKLTMEQVSPRLKNNPSHLWSGPYRRMRRRRALYWMGNLDENHAALFNAFREGKPSLHTIRKRGVMHLSITVSTRAVHWEHSGWFLLNSKGNGLDVRKLTRRPPKTCRTRPV